MPGEPKFSEELKTMEYEPLLPVEKKLIAGSLVLGLVLLGLLIWLSNKFFPAQGAAGILPADASVTNRFVMPTARRTDTGPGQLDIKVALAKPSPPKCNRVVLRNPF